MDKKEVIKQFVTDIGMDGFDNNSLTELILALRREYPQNDMLTKICDALDLEREEDRPETEYPWILFSINDTAYGINSKYVLSIELLGDITPIVDGPHYSPGMTRSRGEMIDLLDMRTLFGLGDYQSAKASDPDAFFMMVVAEINGIKRGLIVDEIISVEHIADSEEGIMGDGGKVTSQYVSLVARREKSDDPVLVIKPENLSTL